MGREVVRWVCRMVVNTGGGEIRRSYRRSDNLTSAINEHISVASFLQSAVDWIT